MRFIRLWTVVLLAVTAPAAEKKPFTVETLLALHRISDPQVSSNGRTVLFTVVTPDLEKNTQPSQIWSVSLEGGEPRQLTHEGTRSQRPRWSPDGRRIAFLSNRDGSQQIWLMQADGSKARRLTDVPGGAGGVLWSPNGRQLLFTSTAYPDCPDMECNRRREQQRTKNPIGAKVFTRLLFRHWNAYKDNKRRHLFLIAADGGTPLDLTPGEYDVPPFSLGGPDEYSFSPDGCEVAYTANLDPVEALSTNKDIFLVPVSGSPAAPASGTPNKARKLTSNLAWDATPVYSPDGRYIAYRAMRRPGYEADRFRLMLYDRKTGRHINLTETYDRSVGFLVWSPDSSRVYFGTGDRATQPILAIDVTGGEPRPVVTGATNGELSITPDGSTLVFTRNSMERPNEIFRAPAPGATSNATIAEPQPVTRLNEPLLADTHLSAPEPFTFTGAGGTPIHAWLLKPPGFDPGRKYPVIFLLHGGPQSAWSDGWSFRWNVQTFAAAGYVLAMVNRRGSTGYGQKFADEINADWGGQAFQDIMNGVAYVEKLPYVDPARIGATGASYGGYMANWIAGHTGRFRCIVSHAGVFDLPSMYGTTEELWFPEWEFRGAPWENAGLYRWLSPSSYVRSFKTPTLVIHGQLDYRVDIGQGLQMYTALQRMEVPSKLIYFPDEGHWILKPANSAFWYRQVIAWWDQWLKPDVPPAKSDGT